MLVRKVSFTPYLLLTARERNKGGTADNVYSSLVILFRLRGIFYCLAFMCANVVKNPKLVSLQRATNNIVKKGCVMKTLRVLGKGSKVLANFSSIFVIAIAVATLLVPSLMSWVNTRLFTDFLGNGFSWQSLIIGFIMFCMGLTLSKNDFKVLAQRPFDICVGAVAQYLIMPLSAFALCKALHLPDALAIGLMLVGCCPGGVSSNIMSYLCRGDVAFSVGMTTVSTLLAPFVTPFLMTLMASGISIQLKPVPMFLSIIETVIVPVVVGFLINFKYENNKTYQEVRACMPGVAVVGLACVVGGVTASQGHAFVASGAFVFLAVFLHNAVGYVLGYSAGVLTRMSRAKKRTVSLEVGMQNAGLATTMATSNPQLSLLPEAAVICAVSCVWHSISGTLLAGAFAQWDEYQQRRAAKKVPVEKDIPSVA